MKKTAFIVLIFVLLALVGSACGGAPVEGDGMTSVESCRTEDAVLSGQSVSVESRQTEQSVPPEEGGDIEVPVNAVLGERDITLLFSRRLYEKSLDSGTVMAEHYRIARTGGFAFTVCSEEELAAFRALLSEYASDDRVAPMNYKATDEDSLYMWTEGSFFDSAVLVFYVDNGCTVDGELWNVEDHGGTVVINTAETVVGSDIPETVTFNAGVSCWAVSRDLMAEKQVFFRSPAVDQLWPGAEIKTPVQMDAAIEKAGDRAGLDSMRERFFPEAKLTENASEGGQMHHAVIALDNSLDVCIGPIGGVVSSRGEYCALLNVLTALCDTAEKSPSVGESFFGKYELVCVLEGKTELSLNVCYREKTTG